MYLVYKCERKQCHYLALNAFAKNEPCRLACFLQKMSINRNVDNETPPFFFAQHRNFRSREHLRELLGEPGVVALPLHRLRDPLLRDARHQPLPLHRHELLLHKGRFNPKGNKFNFNCSV